MIGYIKGSIEEIGMDYFIIENNGVGYKLNASTTTISQLELSSEAKVYTKMIVREDDISLCGFYTKEEEDMFKLLTSVSKVGTKVAMGILSYSPPQRVSQIIANSDVAQMSKAPGVGKKTAERIILELKDKVVKLNFGDAVDSFDKNMQVNVGIGEDGEAVTALVALGYTNQEAQVAVNFVKQPGMQLEYIIKKALEYIMKTSMKF